MNKSKINRMLSLRFPTSHQYGFHCLKCPTYTKTIKTIVENEPSSTCQIYISNPRSKAPAPYRVEDIIEARRLVEIYNVNLFVHGCLLYNLCGIVNHRKDPNFHDALRKTTEGLTREVDIVAGLGGIGVVVHPNSCKDVQIGLQTISETVQNVLLSSSDAAIEMSRELDMTLEEFIRKRCVILENCAGEGTKRGGTLGELAQMIEGVEISIRDQVGICIDTAHAFGAGLYDWGKPSEVQRFYKDFDQEIGLQYLKVFHLNDSRCSTTKKKDAFFGSKKDCHENLGLGYIFGDDISGETEEGSRLEGLKEFFLQAYERNIPIIGEPPHKTEDGNEGPGGILDWEIVEKNLSSSCYPLEEVHFL